MVSLTKGLSLFLILMMCIVALDILTFNLSVASQPTGQWPMFRSDPSHSGLGTSISPINPSLIWKYNLSTTEPIGSAGFVSSPAVSNGVVYVAANNSLVYALDAVNGTRLWKTSGGYSIYSSPAVINDVVCVGCNIGAVIGFDASTGKERWIFSTSFPAVSSPVIIDGVAYVGALNGRIVAINADNGEYVWRVYAQGAVYSSPAIVNRVVYVGSDDGYVYALRADDGSTLWKYETTAKVRSSPAVLNGVVYVSSENGEVFALNAANGAKIWNYSTGIVGSGRIGSSPASVDGVIYFGTADGSVYALKASDGNKLWNFTNTANPPINYYEQGAVNLFVPAFESSPAVADGVVYVGSGNHVLALNASDGQELWRYATGGLVESSPAVVNGVLYVGSDDGFVYALGSIQPSITPKPSPTIDELSWLVIFVLLIPALLVVIILRYRESIR